MFSIKGDTVLDPFLGIGTTMYAAMTAGRNSIGFELDHNFGDSIRSRMDSIIYYSNKLIGNRLSSHLSFLSEKYNTGKEFKYLNKHYEFPVMTRQETDLFLNPLVGIQDVNPNHFEIIYSAKPQQDGCDSPLEHAES